MSVKFEPVIWNWTKIGYDLVLLALITAYIFVYLRVAPDFQDVTRPINGQTLRMQAFGTLAFLMLTAILCIGPLARMDKRFLPLLYNRRHFGVLTCAVAFVHVGHVLGWYYAFSPIDRYEALLISNTSFGQVLGFPFEVFGMISLFLLLVLALTSHDFWLDFLTPPVWKIIHMSVYFAYFALVLHVGVGYLQDTQSSVFSYVVGASVFVVAGLHYAASRREAKVETPSEVSPVGWLVAGTLDDTIDGRALIVRPSDGDRIAVFRHANKLSAITNVCAHQNGPLGEGRVIDGCVTCPWHGFQYDPETGRAPPPFTEKIATYNLKLDGGRILVDPTPNAPGTRTTPIVIPECVP
ncbi:MAG: Rieske 2Fe-2S domain-containing protein [Pseudomonadota bacterium]